MGILILLNAHLKFLGWKINILEIASMQADQKRILWATAMRRAVQAKQANRGIKKMNASTQNKAMDGIKDNLADTQKRGLGGLMSALSAAGDNDAVRQRKAAIPNIQGIPCVAGRAAAVDASANILNAKAGGEAMQQWREQQAEAAKESFDKAARKLDQTINILKISFPDLVEILEQSPEEKHEEILNQWKVENPNGVAHLDNTIDALRKATANLNDKLLNYSNKVLAAEAGKVKAVGPVSPSSAGGDSGNVGNAGKQVNVDAAKANFERVISTA